MKQFKRENGTYDLYAAYVSLYGEDDRAREYLEKMERTTPTKFLPAVMHAMADAYLLTVEPDAPEAPAEPEV